MSLLSDFNRPLKGGARHPGNTECSFVGKRTSAADDGCYVDYKESTSTKPMKYLVNNFHREGCAPNDVCYPGYMPSRDKGLSQCRIDDDTDLRFRKLTRARTPQQLACVPMATVPYMGRGCVSSDTEMQLRSAMTTVGGKPCKPYDTAHYERRFEVFDHLCFNPNATQNVIWPDTRGGMDTRQQRVETYPLNGTQNDPNNRNARNPSTLGAGQSRHEWTSNEEFKKLKFSPSNGWTAALGPLGTVTGGVSENCANT